MRLPRHSAEYHALGWLCIGAIVPAGTLPPDELGKRIVKGKKHRFSNRSLQREPRHPD
jgi:hypothetical protein